MQQHELISIFARFGLQLNTLLVEMLNEHHHHRTERRGCGYTQASRYLATWINQAVDERATGAEILFANPVPNSDIASLQRRINARLKYEESLLLAGLIFDIFRSAPATTDTTETLIELASYPQKIPVGSCPLAEKYFLELAHGHVKRGGRMNVVTDSQDRPLLVEKYRLGDSHSCLSLTPLRLNGVVLPPASLLAVHYPKTITPRSRQNTPLPGQWLHHSDCQFRFLRLTTLAVSPPHRARAFSSHFQMQIDNGLFSPESTDIRQFSKLISTCS